MENQTDKQFLEAIFTGGIQHPNFFNGRILTATDLRDEQAANLKRSHILGQAIGTGIVQGLQVQASNNKRALIITAGLAINPRGDGLHLSTNTTVELVPTAPAAAPSTTPASPFIPCDISSDQPLKSRVATGYYLLALSTATRLSVTMAPNSGLGGDIPGCTNRYEEIGVQFKLIPIGLENFKDFVSDIPPKALDSRSRLAHVCFGTNPLQENNKQPQKHTTTYGLIDALRAQQRLTDCDVPLAVFHFQPASAISSPQLTFVDMWSVRRLATPGMHPQAYAEADFSYFVSPRRPQEAAAFFLQFQNQLEDLRNNLKITPAQLKAQDYFEYLPAAGYLPITAPFTTSGNNTFIGTKLGSRRFNPTIFFGNNIPAQTIQPSQVRSLFQSALYDAPIRPGIDEIDLYQVAGAPTTSPYRLFTRRVPVILPPDPTEDPPTDTPKPKLTGDLTVSVFFTNGERVANEYISAVRAINQKTGKVYTPTREKKRFPFGKRIATRATEAEKREIIEKYELVYQRYQSGTSSTTSSSTKASTENNSPSFSSKSRKSRGRRPKATRKPSETLVARPGKADAYFFNDLPIGTYTVSASLTEKNYQGITKSVSVKPNLSNTASVIVKKLGLKAPGFNGPDVFIPEDDIRLPGGKLLDGYFINPEWPEIYPDWEKDIPLEPIKPGEGWTDPSPDDWFKRADPTLSIFIEDILTTSGIRNPQVAAADAVMFIRNDYNPAQPGDTVTAFVQTQDGTRIPAVPLAADNALDKIATVSRTGIADFDQATVGRLQQAGLADVDAIASAPTNLVAAVLGQSPTYAASLITDTQETLQTDFRTGYLGYPGINKAQSDALKAQFGSRVDLANAKPEDLSSALGSTTGDISGRFAARFLADVQATLPQAAFDLGAAGIDSTGKNALAEIGVSSNQGLKDRVATEAGRNEIKATLNLSDAQLTNLIETTTLNLAKGELLSAPEKSIATLPDVPTNVKTAVADAGIVSAKELANTDPTVLANATGISISEATTLIETAKPYGTDAHLKLIGNANADAAAAAGLTSTGAIARTETTNLESTLTDSPLDTATVTTAIKLSNQLLADNTLFRGSRLNNPTFNNPSLNNPTRGGLQ